MKKFNNTIIIGIDHGYGNIKTASTITPTGITAYDSEPTFAGKILVYDGIHYRIGEGHKAFVSSKVVDSDFYVLTLMAIARELNQHGITEADVHIAAGLPLTWVKSQREEFRKYLLQREFAEFVFNGREYKINFVGCSVYPQGYPAIIGQLDEMNGVNMLADIGNGTMNVMYINNRKPVESKCWTEKVGVNQCVITAQNAVMDSTGAKIDGTVIENVIRKGTADISVKYLDCIVGVCKKYAAELFETLRKYEYNPDLMKLFVVGGGGCMIKHFADYDKNRVVIIDDICATAKGYEQIAFSALRKEVSGGC
ncbi:MAG: ParM/StbA family protein [Oscillospiraceae bacterium]|nr:ParM/StbA family protein [Oscillospiraceae bacterium]